MHRTSIVFQVVCGVMWLLHYNLVLWYTQKVNYVKAVCIMQHHVSLDGIQLTSGLIFERIYKLIQRKFLYYHLKFG